MEYPKRIQVDDGSMYLGKIEDIEGGKRLTGVTKGYETLLLAELNPDLLTIQEIIGPAVIKIRELTVTEQVECERVRGLFNRAKETAPYLAVKETLKSLMSDGG